MGKYQVEVLGDNESLHDNVIAKNMDTAVQLVLTSLYDVPNNSRTFDLIITDKSSKPHKVYIRKKQW